MISRARAFGAWTGFALVFMLGAVAMAAQKTSAQATEAIKSKNVNLVPEIQRGPLLLEDRRSATVNTSSVAGIGTLSMFAMITTTGLDSAADLELLQTDDLNVYQITTNGVVSRYDANGVQTAVSTIPPPSSRFWSDLATDPTTGIVYGVATFCQGTSDSTLHRLNLITGAMTSVSAIGSPCIAAIAFNNAGQLFGVDTVTNKLVKIPKAGGFGTVVGPLGFNADQLAAMDCDPSTDTCYLFAFDGGPDQRSELHSLNLVTGAATFLGQIGNMAPGGNVQIPSAVFGTIRTCANDADCNDNNPCNGLETCLNGACQPGTPLVPVQFCSNEGVTIPQVGQATPYPAVVTVSGMSPLAALCSVQINGYSHTNPDDVDVLLSGPTGGTPNVILMSDVGGVTDVVNINLTLTDGATTNMPDAGPLVSGTFKPTDIEPAEVFPAPAPPSSGDTSLAVFNGVNPNGAWNLWIKDQFTSHGGTITGVCLSLAALDCSNSDECDDGNPCNGVESCVNSVCQKGLPIDCDDGHFCTIDFCVPATGVCGHTPNMCDDGDDCTVDSCGNQTGCSHSNTCVEFCNQSSVAINDVMGSAPTSASPYPTTIHAAGFPSLADVLAVRLNGISHTAPYDIDMLLVSPRGQNAIIMSDVGGVTDAVGVNLTLSDSAGASIALGALVSGTFKPTNANVAGSGTEIWLSPAPAPLGGSALSVFSGQDPNGNWGLFIADDNNGDAGSMGQGWCLKVRTCVPPTEVNDTLLVTKTAAGSTDAIISWTDAPGPFNVYAGRRFGTGSWQYNHDCIDSNVPGPSSDQSLPLEGDALYYLVSRVSSCGESIVGRDSTGVPELNPSPCAAPVSDRGNVPRKRDQELDQDHSKAVPGTAGTSANQLRGLVPRAGIEPATP